MFIQTESTPNPASLKFLPDAVVLEDGTADYPNAEAATSSPLAQRLFQINGVKGVFLGHDFITVTKDASYEWQTLKPQVLAAIMEHLSAGQPIVNASAAPQLNADQVDEISAQIMELLETRVRPAVAMDGGDIAFDRFEDGIVFLHLRGSCAGCPSSNATLKMGIENMLKHYVPEVTEVRAVS
jgi:Fe-S cluster biogenesis protein NfuA